MTSAGYGAFAEVVADVLVRQSVPGPCLGPPSHKKSIARSVSAFERSLEDGEEEDDDVPDVNVDVEQEVETHNVLPGETF